MWDVGTKFWKSKSNELLILIIEILVNFTFKLIYIYLQHKNLFGGGINFSIICLSLCLIVCLTVHLSVCLSVCLYICLSVFLSVCLSVYFSVYVSVFQCVFFVFLSFCLSVDVCLTVCLSVYQLICLSENKTLPMYWTNFNPYTTTSRLNFKIG